MTLKSTKTQFTGHHCWKRGIDFSGGLIKLFGFTTLQACQEECAKTDRCVAFEAIAGAINECRLKDKNHGADTTNALAISAKMRCYEGMMIAGIYHIICL